MKLALLLTVAFWGWLGGSSVAFCDFPQPLQFLFQDPATPMMEGIINLHHDLMFLLVSIAVFVLWMILRVLWQFNANANPTPSKVVQHTVLEVVWTIIPTFFLMFIALPTFALIYAMDEVVSPGVTVKVIGHQWYWSYEYSDLTTSENPQGINFDSYMIPEDDLVKGELRLLEVDRRVVLPIETHIRLLITSADVLHSWAVPSLGIKLDACPGRLNQVSLFIKRPGVFYGQCSEICGINHGFMPIVVEGVELGFYNKWVIEQLSAEGTTGALDQVNEMINRENTTLFLFMYMIGDLSYDQFLYMENFYRNSKMNFDYQTFLSSKI